MGKLPIDGEPLLQMIFLNIGNPSRGPRGTIGPLVLIPGPTWGPNIIVIFSDWGYNQVLIFIQITFGSNFNDFQSKIRVMFHLIVTLAKFQFFCNYHFYQFYKNLSGFSHSEGTIMQCTFFESKYIDFCRDINFNK